ncbi:hypothetical protein D3C78_1615580 [compost metagenome]
MGDQLFFAFSPDRENAFLVANYCLQALPFDSRLPYLNLVSIVQYERMSDHAPSAAVSILAHAFDVFYDPFAACAEVV